MPRLTSILIIDDSSSITERLKLMLGETEFKLSVSTGANYKEAVFLIENNHYDILILDILLPDKSGIQILRYLKELKEKGTDYPFIIMMTNDPSPEREEVCLKLGAQHFLCKFTDLNKIPQIISQTLSKDQ